MLSGGVVVAAAVLGEVRRHGVPGVTDGEGRVEIDGPGPGEPGRLRVVADGFATEVRAAPRPGRCGAPRRAASRAAGDRRSRRGRHGICPAGHPRPGVALGREDPRGGRGARDGCRGPVPHRRLPPTGRNSRSTCAPTTDGRRRRRPSCPPVIPKDPLVRLEIPGRGRCVGVVLGIDGRPVARAVVRLVRRAGPMQRHQPRAPRAVGATRVPVGRATGRTGDDGSFRVAGLAFGEEYVAFAAPASARRRRSRRRCWCRRCPGPRDPDDARPSGRLRRASPTPPSRRPPGARHRRRRRARVEREDRGGRHDPHAHAARAAGWDAGRVLARAGARHGSRDVEPRVARRGLRGRAGGQGRRDRGRRPRRCARRRRGGRPRREAGREGLGGADAGGPRTGPTRPPRRAGS